MCVCVKELLSGPDKHGSTVNDLANRRGPGQSVLCTRTERRICKSHCKNQNVEERELQGTGVGMWKTWVCVLRQDLTGLVEVSRRRKDLNCAPDCGWSKTLSKDCKKKKIQK